MELTIEKAYELAVKKWEYIVKNDGDNSGQLAEIPELRHYNAQCSYCEMFIKSPVWCKGCPLAILPHEDYEHGCLHKDHPYNKWDMNSTRETAQAVLDLIIKTKPF